MGMIKYGAAAVVEPSIYVDDWVNTAYKTACAGGKCRMKTARSVIAKYDPKKYLLSHATIIAAVDVDEAPSSESPYKDYLIKPEYSKFVNNNGDAWTKQMLDACYRTFIGANNFLEHIQIEELSKGKVIDAVKREVPIGKTANGKDLTTYYVDILVATDRKHDDLVRKIEAGDISKLSMGCTIQFSICSKCGKKAVDEAEACRHVRYEKNNTFYDKNGVQRKIAELCGHHSIPESVQFVDASWVKNPAFTGAVLRSEVAPSSEIMAKIESAHAKEAYKVKEGDLLKVARHLIAQDEEEDTPPPPVEETPEDEETTPEETPLAPEEETPAPETPEEVPEEPDVEFDQDDVKQWKTRIKKRLLEELSDEVEKEFSQMEEAGPRELETLDQTLIKPASLVLKKVYGAKKSWDRYIKQSAGNLPKEQYDKLRYGTHMVLTSNDLTVLSKYGYNKRDFLAVMSFLDDHFKKPLALPVKKAIAKLGGTNSKGPIELLSHVVDSIGRKISREEAGRILTWLKLLDHYS